MKKTMLFLTTAGSLTAGSWSLYPTNVRDERGAKHHGFVFYVEGYPSKVTISVTIGESGAVSRYESTVDTNRGVAYLEVPETVVKRVINGQAKLTESSVENECKKY